MLEEILKKQSLDENDIKIINQNIHLLSDADKIRLGMSVSTNKEVEEVEEVEEVVKPVVTKKSRSRSK